MTHKDNKTARDESSAVLLNNNNIDIDKRLHEILDNADLYEKDGYGGYEVNKEWLVPQIQALFTTTLQQREQEARLEIINLYGNPRCENLHHSKKDRHYVLEACPVIDRIKSLSKTDKGEV